MSHRSPDDYREADRAETTQVEESSRLADSRRHGPRLILILVTLLIVLAMLATLVGPLLGIRPRRQPTPTPTPALLQEVRSIVTANSSPYGLTQPSRSSPDSSADPRCSPGAPPGDRPTVAATTRPSWP
jgi:hypothetical protein